MDLGIMGLKGSKRKRAGRGMPCVLGDVWEALEAGVQDFLEGTMEILVQAVLASLVLAAEGMWLLLDWRKITEHATYDV